MSLAARIDRFLAAVHSADNMASARDKLAEATELLREVAATELAQTNIQSRVVHSSRELLEAIDELSPRDRTPVSVYTGSYSSAGRKPAAKIRAGRSRKG